MFAKKYVNDKNQINTLLVTIKMYFIKKKKKKKVQQIKP